MASIVYETPMMVWHRMGDQATGKPAPAGAFKIWVLDCQKRRQAARSFYLQHRAGFTQEEDVYDFVKNMNLVEKRQGQDCTNIPFTILHEVFGDLW